MPVTSICLIFYEYLSISNRIVSNENPALENIVSDFSGRTVFFPEEMRKNMKSGSQLEKD